MNEAALASGRGLWDAVRQRLRQRKLLNPTTESLVREEEDAFQAKAVIQEGAIGRDFQGTRVAGMSRHCPGRRPDGEWRRPGIRLSECWNPRDGDTRGALLDAPCFSSVVEGRDGVEYA